MAYTLKELLLVLQLVTFGCCITTVDKNEELKTKNVDAKDIQDDLDSQETGWIYNPLQDKTKTLEYLKEKAFHPFSALKSPSTSFGGGYPLYASGVSNTYYPGYLGIYPAHSFSGSGSYYPSPKPKQYHYYNPIHTPYKKSYPPYPSKTWYNKNYFSSGGNQIHTATYAPDCYYSTSGPTFQYSTTSLPSYSSGTPLHYNYPSGTPTQTYGAPGFNIGVKTAISGPTSPAPYITYPSHFQPSYTSQTPANSYIWRISSSPQYSDDSSHSSGGSPSFPTFSTLTSTPAPPQLPSTSSSTYSPSSISAIPSGPTTPSSPFSSTPSPPSIISTTSTPTLSSFPNSVPSGPSSIPIPIVYSQSDEGPSQEVVITPPPPTSKNNYVTTLPGPSIALPESSYLYNQPPSYAVSYYPNVFYISNEQRLEKTSSAQSVTGTHEESISEGTSDDSGAPSPSSDSQSTISNDTNPSTKSQSSVQTLPGPGLTTFYSSQTLDQTRIPISGQYVVPQTPGVFYSAPIVPNVYGGSLNSGGSGSYVASSQGSPYSPPPLGYQLPLGYVYGQPSIGYQTTRTSTNC